jgi:hypothetical protein
MTPREALTAEELALLREQERRRAARNCNSDAHDDPRWCDTHEARWPDPTSPCLGVRP